MANALQIQVMANMLNENIDPKSLHTHAETTDFNTHFMCY